MLKSAKNKPCKKCGSPDHTGFHCFIGRKPLKTTLQLKPRKRMKPHGKHYENWQATRKKWIELNPSDENGYYYCYLCGRPITKGKPDIPNGRMTLDHIKSRSRHPELRYELSNLKPCCWWCNTDKGSRDLEELNAENYQRGL